MASIDASLPAGQVHGHVRFEKRTLTAEEAAAVLGVSPDVLRDNWQALGGFRVGRVIRFPQGHVEALVAAPRHPAPPSAAAVPADPRVDAVLETTRVLARELARLLSDRRREARDPDAKRELSEARMAVEDCLADLNALARPAQRVA